MHRSDRPSHRRRRLVATLTALGALAGATTAHAATPRPQQRELHFAVGAGVDSLCPPSADWGPAGVQVATAIYDTLTVPDRDGRFAPYLAQSVTGSADATTWTIHLRNGVRFHNGDALDAAAVKLNLDAFAGRVSTVPPARGRPVLDFLASVDVIGPLMLVARLEHPVPDFAAYLYLGGRLAIAAPTQLRSPECATRAVGTGPYRVASYLPVETVVTRNADYWQPGYPKARRIVFDTILDGAQRVRSVQSGAADFAQEHLPEQLERIGRLKRVSVLEEEPGFRQTHYLLFNVARAPFDDQAARAALAYGLDRDALNDAVHGGQALEARGLMDVEAPGHVEDAGYPERDPERARQLVTQVGVRSGQPFTLSLLVETDGTSHAEARELARQLAELAITVRITQATPQQLPALVAAGDFDLLLRSALHGGNAVNCDVDTVPWWSSGSAGNVGRITDERIQSLLTQTRAASTSGEATTACRALNEAMARSVWVLPLWTLTWGVVHRDDVELTLPPLPDGREPLFVGGRIPVHALVRR